MAGYDTWFGFELNQRYTLEKKLAPLEEAAAIIAALPTSDQTDGETVWNDNGVLKVSSV